MLLSVVSTKDYHIMAPDPDRESQSKRRGLAKLPQHGTRPCSPGNGTSQEAAPELLRSSNLVCPLRRCGVLGPTEHGYLVPHPVRYHGAFSGKRDSCPLHAAPLSNFHRPALRRRKPHCSCEYDMQRLEHRPPNHGIANPTGPIVNIARTGWTLLQRQSKIGANHRRCVEPTGIVDR